MSLYITSIILGLSVCMDSLLACFSYGASSIKIPITSLFIINFICTTTIGISLCIGTALKNWIPLQILPIIRFSVLFLMGCIRLLDGFIKTYIKKHGQLQNHVSFSLFNLHFILNVYSSPEKADSDASQELTSKEAVSLGIALSLDGLVIGIGAALTHLSVPFTILITFLIGMIFSFLGYILGKKIASKLPFDFTFLSGICLLFLAFLSN